MIKQVLLFAFLVVITSCSKDDSSMMEPEPPEPLTIIRINGFVSTGPSTFQVTNLLSGTVTRDIQVTSPFFVEFSKPVLSSNLMNETLPKLLKMENGEAVAGVTLNITIPSDRELTLEPAEELEPGTTYQLVINPGYKAEDGGVFDEHAIANFETVN